MPQALLQQLGLAAVSLAAEAARHRLELVRMQRDLHVAELQAEVGAGRVVMSCMCYCAASVGAWGRGSCKRAGRVHVPFDVGAGGARLVKADWLGTQCIAFDEVRVAGQHVRGQFAAVQEGHAYKALCTIASIC